MVSLLWQHQPEENIVAVVVLNAIPALPTDHQKPSAPDRLSAQDQMCQYYHWRCGVCLTDNEIAQRCGRMRERCAKHGDLLPLPPDAEGISCQWCRRPRFADQNQAPPRFQHAVRPIQTTTKCAAKTEAQWRVPAENDAFWLRPSTRLPDAAEKMAQYDRQRHLVLKAADQAMGLKQCSQGGANMGSNRQTFLYDEAWRKLKEGLQTG